MRTTEPARTDLRPETRRLPRALRLLVLEAPSPARQSLIAMAKVLGVEDITAVECLADAYAALENAPFDVMVYDAEAPEWTSTPIAGLLGQLRAGALGGANAEVAVVAKASPVNAPVPATDIAAPDQVLATPLRLDRVRGVLAWAAADRPDQGALAA